MTWGNSQGSTNNIPEQSRDNHVLEDREKLLPSPLTYPTLVCRFGHFLEESSEGTEVGRDYVRTYTTLPTHLIYQSGSPLARVDTAQNRKHQTRSDATLPDAEVPLLWSTKY